jgi:hypothetical protein
MYFLYGYKAVADGIIKEAQYFTLTTGKKVKSKYILSVRAEFLPKFHIQFLQNERGITWRHKLIFFLN